MYDYNTFVKELKQLDDYMESTRSHSTFYCCASNPSQHCLPIHPKRKENESLHHEQELLVKAAGINASEVIRIATKNGAEALDLINQTGTIEAGKEADVLILSPNPIEDMAYTKRIDAFISNGMIVDRSKIQLDPI